MSRAAIIADSHFDSGSRFEECIRIHDWIADDIAARGVDVVLHAGDVFERKSNPDERRAVAAWIQRVTEHAPLVIVRGNHDAPRDLSIFAKLETQYPVIVEEGAGVHRVGGFIVGCMAWPTKASVLALGAQSHAEGELIAGEALRNVLRGLGQQLHTLHERTKEPRVLLAHAMVRGSETSTGQPLVGCDFELGLDDLKLADVDLYALGHIHMPQHWDWQKPWNPSEDATAIYPGSPRRTAFGELEEKGYVIAEFDHDTVQWQRVPTPCTPMVQIEGAWGLWGDSREPGLSITSEHYPHPERVVGAEVRFRYTVPADQRAGARADAETWRRQMLDAGAVHVKVEEEVLPTGSARAPEVAHARTLADKLLAMWKARHAEPEPPRVVRLLSMAHELEGKCVSNG